MVRLATPLLLDVSAMDGDRDAPCHMEKVDAFRAKMARREAAGGLGKGIKERVTVEDTSCPRTSGAEASGEIAVR